MNSHIRIRLMHSYPSQSFLFLQVQQIVSKSIEAEVKMPVKRVVKMAVLAASFNDPLPFHDQLSLLLQSVFVDST